MPEYSSDSFGSVLDKGTLDAMACGDHASDNIRNMLSEISR